MNNAVPLGPRPREPHLWLCWCLTLKCTDTLCLPLYCLSLASHLSGSPLPRTLALPSVSLSLQALQPQEPGWAIPRGRDACRTRPGLPGPDPSPSPSPARTWFGCQGDEGSGARLFLRAAAGLREAPGGQAASSRDRPPTQHISILRTAGPSPGPARRSPLAPTQNTPPYGLPRGGCEEEKKYAKTRRSLASPQGARDPSRTRGRAAGPVPDRCP